MQTKEQGKKAVKQRYTFINVRVKPETKAAMAKLAKKRQLSLSKAVEALIEAELKRSQAPERIDPTITLTADEIEAYERPQWLSAGKPVPVNRGPWFKKLLDRLFG